MERELSKRELSKLGSLIHQVEALKAFAHHIAAADRRIFGEKRVRDECIRHASELFRTINHAAKDMPESVSARLLKEINEVAPWCVDHDAGGYVGGGNADVVDNDQHA